MVFLGNWIVFTVQFYASRRRLVSRSDGSACITTPTATSARNGVRSSSSFWRWCYTRITLLQIYCTLLTLFGQEVRMGCEYVFAALLCRDGVALILER